MSEVDDVPPVPWSPPVLPEEQQVAPEVVATLERLVDEVVAEPEAQAFAERLEALIGLLMARGHLALRHGKLLRRLNSFRPSVVRLSVVQDKRSVPSPDVDCASLLHLCKGRCCALKVALSEEDLAERRLEWDLQRPYELRRDPGHGYCSYLGERGRCTVYEDRPATCRSYDCRADPRVWLDFERRLPAPLPWHLVPEAWLPEDEDGGADGAAQAAGDGPTTSAG